MIAWLAAALLVFAPPIDPLVGTYATHQMEVGAKLELRGDGTFRYMLDYGAVSEAGEGHWTADKGVVHLVSDPLAIELLREIERSDAAFTDEQLKVDEGALVMRRHETIFAFHPDKP
jgi:hypothetical protein